MNNVNNSKLLFDEQPLIISRELANLIGLNESIILQQIHYWIEINRKANVNFKDGKYWTYNSIKNWHEKDFTFWSYNTVKRTFSNLEKKGFLISSNYNVKKYDQTKWYTIDYEALEALKTLISPKWVNGLAQNESMDCTKMGRPIPEIKTEIKTEIKNPILSNQEEKKEEKNDRIRCDKIVSETVKIVNEPVSTTKQKPINQVTTPITSNKKKLGKTVIRYQYNQVESVIKGNIDYNILLHDNITSQETLDEIVFAITTTICTEYKRGYISMGKEDVPAEAVKSIFFKLNSEHIKYFIDCFDKQTNIITKLPAYICKALYRNYGTIGHYYTNLVNHNIK